MLSDRPIPLFSIIIPVYNVIDYIKNTIDSIRAQSFSNYELLLIDDGSTDGSDLFIDNIAKSDKRIIAFHQPNSGVSAARNLGLEKAKGQWIVFVDGDDALKIDALQILANTIAKHPDVDLIGYGFDRVSTINPNLKNDFNHTELLIDCNKTVSMKVLDHYMVWGETFRRDMFNNLRFENLNNGEDVLFCNSLACRTQKYIELNAKLYLYLQRDSSAKVNAWTTKRFEDYSLMNRLILNNLLSCNKRIDRTWLKRWIGSLLQYVSDIWQQPAEIQEDYFSKHWTIMQQLKNLNDIPTYLKLWIYIATAIKSKTIYKYIAMKPMNLYSNLVS